MRKNCGDNKISIDIDQTNYAEVIKTDREIRKLYGLSDEICPTDKELFYKIDIDERISQELHKKQRWITRWRPAIQSSRKRAKRNGTTNTKAIWTYFGTKKPKNRLLHASRKRLKQHKDNLRKQRNAPVRGIMEGNSGFKSTGTKRSTSRKQTEPTKRKIFRIINTSVTDYFSKKKNEKEPANRFGDADND